MDSIAEERLRTAFGKLLIDKSKEIDRLLWIYNQINNAPEETDKAVALNFWMDHGELGELQDEIMDALVGQYFKE